MAARNGLNFACRTNNSPHPAKAWRLGSPQEQCRMWHWENAGGGGGRRTPKPLRCASYANRSTYCSCSRPSVCGVGWGWSSTHTARMPVSIGQSIRDCVVNVWKPQHHASITVGHLVGMPCITLSLSEWEKKRQWVSITEVMLSILP